MSSPSNARANNPASKRSIRTKAMRSSSQFTIARFDVIRCMPLLRLPGGSGPGDLTDAQVDARRRVSKAVDALGPVPAFAAWIDEHDVLLESYEDTYTEEPWMRLVEYRRG